MKCRGCEPEIPHLYLIGCGPMTKIGASRSPLKRLRSLQAQVPFTLTLLGAWPTDHPVQDEKALLAMFACYRIRGEWFKLPRRILAHLLSAPGNEVAHPRSTRLAK
jgi:hypothetical protein